VVVEVWAEAWEEVVDLKLASLLDRLQALPAEVAVVVAEVVALEVVVEVVVVEVAGSSLAVVVEALPQLLCCNGNCNCKAGQAGSHCFPLLQIGGSRTPLGA